MADYGRVEWQYAEDADTTRYHSAASRTKETAEALAEDKRLSGCVNVKIIPFPPAAGR